MNSSFDSILSTPLGAQQQSTGLLPDFLTFLQKFQQNGQTPDSISTAPQATAGNLSTQIQESLGAKQPEQGGQVKNILASRFPNQGDMMQSIASSLPQGGPSYGDYASSAISALNGKFTPANDYASSDLAGKLKSIGEISRASFTAGGGAGNATLKAAQMLMQNDPNLDAATAFSIAKSGVGQGNTVVNGKMQNIGGAPQAVGNIEYGKEAGKQTAEVQAAAPKAAGTETGKLDVERQAGYTKAQGALRGLEQQSGIVANAIDKAQALADSPTATGWGSYLSAVPNSDAGKLNNYLNTIRANVGFDKLQQMRDNSPTGGALGPVSDFENKLLQAVNGAMDTKQPDQLKENLAIIKNLYPQVIAEKKRAFAQDYGGYAPLGGNTQPPPAAPTVGAPSGAIDYKEYFK